MNSKIEAKQFVPKLWFSKNDDIDAPKKFGAVEHLETNSESKKTKITDQKSRAAA